MLNNTENIISWLEDLLKARLNKDIYILKIIDNKDKYFWQIRIKNSSCFIQIPVFKNLYQLGIQNDLDYVNWKPPEKYFKNFKFELSLPDKKFIEQDFIVITNSCINLKYDILGLIYWMLCRCEEVNTDKLLLDKYERFLSFRSHSYQYNYLQRPIVDEWIMFLKDLINLLLPNINFIETNFEVLITHDVDHILKNTLFRPKSLLKNLAIELLREKNIKKLILDAYDAINCRNFLSENDPFNNFEWMMDQSEKRGFKSTFNFICGRTSKAMDASYEINDKSIINLIKKISSRGHQIGLHPSFNSYKSQKAIISESEKFLKITTNISLKQEIWGSRMHFLKWKWPETAWYLSETHIDYDSTLSYADMPGFRCGTCHPYQMFDPVSLKSINIIQKPLILMECSLFSPKYMGLSYSKKAYSEIAKLKKACKEVKGKFIILWHNSELISKDARSLFINCIS